MLGVIVAGGASKRMGTEKALVKLGDKTMFDHVASALGTACDRIVVAGRIDPIGPWELIPDEGERHRGPLAGLAAVAQRYPSDRLLMVGVDQPWVRPDTLHALVRFESDLPVVPVDGGFRQPLCALYSPGLGSLATEELENRGSLQSLLDVTAYEPVTNWAEWGEDGRSWFSADDMGAVDEGIRRFGLPG